MISRRGKVTKEQKKRIKEVVWNIQSCLPRDERFALSIALYCLGTDKHKIYRGSNALVTALGALIREGVVQRVTGSPRDDSTDWYEAVSPEIKLMLATGGVGSKDFFLFAAD